MLKFVRWDEEYVVTHDLLRMRNDVITLDQGHSGHVLFACNNSRMVVWIFMKFGVEIIALEANPKPYFQISCSR
jgi:hypothetical protein